MLDADADPRPSVLSESLRAFGYDLSTAIADLIDNSLAVSASEVWVDFHWAAGASVIVVTDNGDGMSSEGLLEAMRLGSKHPLVKRSGNDLGRFGLGLKTASFSQCRRLTVRSQRADDKPVTMCWDLDYVAKVDAWKVLLSASESTEPHFERLGALRAGTAVVWEKLDRLVDSAGEVDSDVDQDEFLRMADSVTRHLSVAFHRYIEETSVAISVNGRRVEPWDPFLSAELATQVLPAVTLGSGDEAVVVEPFILPHHSKVSKARYALAAGPRGWVAHQGFYVYRNRRLLLSGGWLGLGWPKDEHHKLARIRVDFPTSSDHLWSIDVTKSKASAPRQLRSQLKQVAERTRTLARRVFTFRGANVTSGGGPTSVALWSLSAKHDRVSYILNRHHPLVQSSLAACTNPGALSALLRLVEETVPLPHIAITSSEKPETLRGPFEGAAVSEIENVLGETIRALVAVGISRADAIASVAGTWPFTLFPDILERLSGGSVE